MKRFTYQYFILFIAVMVLGSSCKKNFSNDDPFPPEYFPSLYIASDNKILYSYDINTLKKNWEFAADNEVKATPVIFDNSVIMVSYSGTIYKLDRITGKIVQERKLSEIVDATPYVHEDKVIFCTRSGRVIVLLGNDINAAPVWQKTVSGPIKASPTVKQIEDSDNIAVIGATMTGTVFALNIEDGATIWSRNIPASGGFYSSPDASPYTIYLGGYNDGKVYSLKTLNGATNWTYTTGGKITASPVSVGGNVMIGSWDRNFYSIDSLTGLERWKIVTGDKVESSAFYDNQYVYFGSNDQHLYCIDVINGIETWKRRTYGVIRSSPIVHNNKVYTGSWDKNLYINRTEDSGLVEGFIPINGLIETSPIIDAVTNVVYPTVSGNNRNK